jgi:hypothetical protein
MIYRSDLSPILKTIVSFILYVIKSDLRGNPHSETYLLNGTTDFDENFKK